jgi:hypothetical protein
MAQVNFDEIFSALKEDIIALSQATLKNYIKDAKHDGLKILDASKEKLQRWTELLSEGKLTTEDFEWLVMSQKDLVEMQALKQAGLAAIRIDQFKNSVFNLLIDTVLHLVKI